MDVIKQLAATKNDRERCTVLHKAPDDELMEKIRLLSISDLSFLTTEQNRFDLSACARAEHERRTYFRTWIGIYIALFTSSISIAIGLINMIQTYYKK